MDDKLHCPNTFHHLFSYNRVLLDELFTFRNPYHHRFHTVDGPFLFYSGSHRVIMDILFHALTNDSHIFPHNLQQSHLFIEILTAEHVFGEGINGQQCVDSAGIQILVGR